MKIAVLGAGLIGLVTGACFAEAGNDVFCFDTDAARVHALQRAELGLFEPGLGDMVKRNVQAGRLQFTDDVARAVRFAGVQFIDVGAPPFTTQPRPTPH